MCAQTLRSFFEDRDQQRRALDSFFKSTWGTKWFTKDGERWSNEVFLEPYEDSRTAFDSSSTADEAFQSFEKVYDLLKRHWQVFRTSRPGAECWQAPKIFKTIKREFVEFSWSGRFNLLNFPDERSRADLVRSLEKMRGIKRMNGYPHMAVSKFLHFYNPGLFPIYDTKVIWGEVFTRFKKNDFQNFCRTANIQYDEAIKDDTETFLIHYMRWASSLLSAAHPRFMQVFCDRLLAEDGTRLPKLDLTKLYATAFEFTAIGAAESSSDRTKEVRARAG